MADPALDQFQLEDTRVTRRYFGKFQKLTGHLGRVAALMEAEGRFTRTEVEAVGRTLVALTLTFRALAYKYHFSGRWPHAGKLTFDRVESGFPVLSELLLMANDMAQAESHLAALPPVAALKDQMVRVIVGERQVPTRLQFALSQRLYYEELVRGGLFLARNDPEPTWLGNVERRGRERRRFLLRWSVWDGLANLPVLYLMELEDSGRTGLPKDDARWPQVQAHLMAQALGGLKLLTIATGFDADFDDLHPKELRQIQVGPMYSSAFTRQEGPIREVLAKANAPEGEDWALAWTDEELVSERVAEERSGWFGSVEREIFSLGPGPDSGTTRTERAVILPERPFQALASLDPPGFRDVRKFVVAPSGRVVSYR